MITEQDIEIAYDIMMDRQNGNRSVFDAMPGNKIARILNLIHSHAEIVYDQNPDQIVYRKDDVIALLIALGAPAPDFGTK